MTIIPLRRMSTLPAAAVLLASAVAAQEPVLVHEEDPARVDLGKLIECTTYDVPSYTGLALWLTGDEAAAARAHLGLAEAPSGNPMLSQYRLAAPITVFGQRTDVIVFTASGPMAVLDEADPHPLAARLGVTASVDTAGKYLGEKEISAREETMPDVGMVLRTRISLNVSTVDSHPSKTLAGCSYAIDVE